jgi:predicted ATPase
LRLVELEIKNFRSLKNIQLTFNGLTGILGGVSVGKSNLLLSLELFWNSELLAQEQDTERLKNQLYTETISKIPEPSILNSLLSNGSIFAQYVFEINNINDLRIFEDVKSPIELYINEYVPKQIIVELKFDSQTNHLTRKLGLSNNNNKNNIYWIDLPQAELQFWHEIIGRTFIISLKDEMFLTLEEDLTHLLRDHYVKNIFQRYVSDILGETCEFLVVGDENGFGEYIIYLSRVNSDSLLPLRYISKGTKRLLRIISYLVDLKYRENSCILVIDDPEIYLQAREQRALADLLVDNISNNQIIFSTASLRFLIGDLYLAHLDHNLTSLKKIDSANDNDVELLVKTLGIRPSDSLSADAVIFLEGYIDKAVLETWYDIVQSSLDEGQFFYSKRVPRISFIPIDGWTKMSFIISVRILKEKFVRSKAFALVDGDTYESDPGLFAKIFNSFERVFGDKTFFKLNEPCIESIMLNNPRAIAKVFKMNEQSLSKRIDKMRKKNSDKEVLKKIYLEFAKTKLREERYNSKIAQAIAHEFKYEEIPNKLIHIFKKIAWIISDD